MPVAAVWTDNMPLGACLVLFGVGCGGGLNLVNESALLSPPLGFLLLSPLDQPGVTTRFGPVEGRGGLEMKAGIVAGWDRFPVAPGHLDITSPRAVMDAPRLYPSSPPPPQLLAEDP